MQYFRSGWPVGKCCLGFVFGKQLVFWNGITFNEFTCYMFWKTRLTGDAHCAAQCWNTKQCSHHV